MFAGNDKKLWVIDTGASKTAFDSALKENFEPVEMDENTQIQSTGLGAAQLDTSLGKLHPFSLSGFKVNSLHVAVIDLSHINLHYKNLIQREVCGLIGSDFLWKYKAVIDYVKLELRLENA